MNSNHLSDGALAELLIIRCGLSFTDVYAFLAARDELARASSPPPEEEEAPDTIRDRDTLPCRGNTERIPACSVEEAAE